VKLTTGPVIGLLTINSGSATMKPYVLAGDLRKKGISIYTHPPPVALGETALLSGPFL
jgi:hypothetical protein